MAFPALGLAKIIWAVNIILEMNIPGFDPARLGAKPQPEWHDVAALAELPADGVRRLEVGDRGTLHPAHARGDPRLRQPLPAPGDEHPRARAQGTHPDLPEARVGVRPLHRRVHREGHEPAQPAGAPAYRRSTGGALVGQLLEAAAKAYLAQDLASAAKHCDEVLAQAPGNAAALNLRAMIHLRADESGLAEARARRAVEIAPDQPSFQHTLAYACRQQGRLDEAARHYDSRPAPRCRPPRFAARARRGPGASRPARRGEGKLSPRHRAATGCRPRPLQSRPGARGRRRAR